MRRAAIAVLAACALAAPALADEPAPAQPAPAEPPLPAGELPPSAVSSRIPEIAATAVTIVLSGATLAAIERWDEYQDRRRAGPWEHRTPEEHQAIIDNAERWKLRSWGLIIGTFASAAVTAFLWTRHQTAADFSVQPTDDGAGATVSYGSRF